MAASNIGAVQSFVAAADLTTHQYKFVSLNTSGQLVLGTAGNKALGVLLNDPALNEEGSVQLILTAIVTAGATVAAGADLAVGANGTAVTATTGDIVEAVALEAGVNGQLISVLLRNQGVAA